MQNLINQLSVAIEADRQSIAEIQRQIEAVKEIGIDQLRLSTLVDLEKAITFLEKSISRNRESITDLIRVLKKGKDGL